MAGESTNQRNDNSVADGNKIPNNGPTLAVDHIIVMVDNNTNVPDVTMQKQKGTVHSSSSQSRTSATTNASAKEERDDFAGAGAADVEERHRTVSSRELFALRISALYAAVTSLALWSVADNPQTVVWVFSTLTSAYFVISTVILTRTMRSLTVFISVSYMSLLAIAIAHLSSRIGMVVMHLDTAYAAGLFGYALAEHRQFIGVENCAAALITMLPSSISEEEKVQEADTGCLCFYAAIVSLLCAAGAGYVLCFTKDTVWLVVGISFLVDLSIYCWTCIVTLHLLRCVLVQVTHMTLIYLIGPSMLFVLNVTVYYFFGMAIGTLVHSVGMIGMTGFFGYSLGVYAHYKHLVKLMDEVVSMEVSNRLPLVRAFDNTVTKEGV